MDGNNFNVDDVRSFALAKEKPEKFWPERVRVRVPFRPEFFRPFFRYCLSSIAKLRRSLTLKFLVLS